MTQKADKPHLRQTIVRETLCKMSRTELLKLVMGDTFDPNLANEIHIRGGGGAGRVEGDFLILFVQYNRTDGSADEGTSRMGRDEVEAAMDWEVEDD